MSRFKKFFSGHILLIALVVMSLPFRLYHVTFPLLDSFYFRQSQTATFALNFYKSGINFFQTELDIFGIGKERFLVLEFPIYEAVVAILYRLFFFHELWGRVVSIIAGYIGAYFIYQITYLILQKRTIAFFSAFFFLFAPLNIFYHRSFMIDPTIIAFLLSGLYFGLRWIMTCKLKFLVLSVILFSLGFIQKGLYGPFWFLPLIFFSIQKRTFKSILHPSFLALIIIPVSTLLLWQQYMNITNTSHGQFFFTTVDAAHLEWNFGEFADRFSKEMWQVRINQVLNGIFLKPGLILFFIGLVVCKSLDKTSFFYIFLVSQILYFITLFRIQAQNYYQLVMIPAFSVFIGIGCYQIVKFVKGALGSLFPRIKLSSLLSPLVLTFFLIFYVMKSWQNALPSFSIDWEWLQRIQRIEEKLPPNSFGVFVTPGYDWNSVYSYYLKRKLYSVSIEDISKEKVQNLKLHGYSFIILYDYESYSRYLQAVKRNNDYSFIDTLPKIFQEQGLKVYLL